MNRALEALKEIRDICSGMTTVFDEDLDTIEQEIKRLEVENHNLFEANKAREKYLHAIEILKSKTEIVAYHSRHSESGYELRIGSMDDDCFFLNLNEEEYNVFMEVLQ